MSEKNNWAELFPTKWSAVVFISYMALFINQGILVTASQNSENSYNYNIVTVVLLTEVLKLLFSTGLYCKDHPLSALFIEIRKHFKVLLLYFVPSFLYCLYNNLAFVNLSAFDPTTYYLLLQLRVVVTGIVYQVLFKKHLSAKQWVSLILLTIGCMIKQINLSNISDETKSSSGFHLSWNIILILVQTVCSCCAGVYNEYLLKGEGADVNIYVQNVFMYIDSIICNLGIIIFQGKLSTSFTSEALESVFTLKVLLIMLNNAFIGIITSFFLKNLNSILKTFASALELMFTAFFCWILFGIPIYLNTIVAISVVSYAVILYSQNPVVNPPKEHEHQDEELEREKLIEEV